MTEQEKQEFFEAALKLADLVKNADDYWSSFDASKVVDTIEKYRPAPKLVEGWVNVAYDGTILSGIYTAKEYAIKNALASSTRKGVYVREVTDPPSWNQWVAFEGRGEIETGAERVRSYNLSRICELHNAEMRRVGLAWKGKK
jgi:hypothetical protein